MEHESDIQMQAFHNLSKLNPSKLMKCDKVCIVMMQVGTVCTFVRTLVREILVQAECADPAVLPPSSLSPAGRPLCPPAQLSHESVCSHAPDRREGEDCVCVCVCVCVCAEGRYLSTRALHGIQPLHSYPRLPLRTWGQTFRGNEATSFPLPQNFRLLARFCYTACLTHEEAIQLVQCSTEPISSWSNKCTQMVIVLNVHLSRILP